MKEQRLIDNKLIKSEKIKIAYYRDPFSGRVTTILYRFHKSVVEFSTAVCSPKDQFSKAQGKHIALTRFRAGKVVFLPGNLFFKLLDF